MRVLGTCPTVGQRCKGHRRRGIFRLTSKAGNSTEYNKFIVRQFTYRDVGLVRTGDQLCENGFLLTGPCDRTVFRV